jgi:hypothetical protein
MSRTRWPLAALALVALIGLAGCSNAPAATGTGSSGGSNTATNREQAMKFAACMRHNGVSAFPDPRASGAFTVDAIVNGSSLDPNSAAWQTAIGACKDLEPAGFMGGMRSAQEQEAALKFAQCIRDNGVKDFPDPVNGEPLVDTNRIPSAATRGGMSILNAAMQKCRDYARGAMTGAGDQ